MGVLPPPPPPSKFALTAPTYSASCASGATSQAVVPPQTGDSTATSTSSKTISKHDIATDVKGQSSLRPLWRNGEKTFPYKVYDMLEFAETSGNSDICAWLPSGESFVIHDRKLFTEFLLPRFFLHKKWRSFVSIICCVIHLSHALVVLPNTLTYRNPLPFHLPPFCYRLANSTFGASDVTLASQYLMPIAIHSLSVGKWPRLPVWNVPKRKTCSRRTPLLISASFLRCMELR